MTKSIKLITILISLIVISSCKSSVKEEKITVSAPDALDTLIQNSQKNFEMSSKISRATDSTVTQKVDHTVKKITQMEGEIKQLKQENHELKVKLSDANDDGKPFNIRSISDN